MSMPIMRRIALCSDHGAVACCILFLLRMIIEGLVSLELAQLKRQPIISLEDPFPSALINTVKCYGVLRRNTH